MAKPRDERQKDLLKPALDQIIDLGHPLARLAGTIDWEFLGKRFSSVCTSGPGQPPLPTRLVAGLFILKHMHNLSDEVLCARWVENPYYQFFCGEETFQHAPPFDRSSLTRWRQRLGEEHLVALIQESLSVAHKTGALKTQDLERVVVDTTVQPKAIAHPTDARLLHRALEKLVRLAQETGVKLRQSYARLAKRAAIMVGRYSHAHQFKRARRQLKFLRTRLGRVIRDICRKIEGKSELESRFGPLLDLALRVRFPPLEDSGLVMRVLSGSPQRLVASPELVKRHGTVAHPADLAGMRRRGIDAEITQRLTPDAAVWHDHLHFVVGDQLCPEGRQLFDGVGGAAADPHLVTDPKRSEDQEHHPRGQIRKCTLQGKDDRKAGGTEDRDEAGRLDAEL